MADEIPEYPTRRVKLVPCPVCGRNFNTETFPKHQSICKKVTSKKRRVFDAGKQRAKDSDVPYKATKTTALVYAGKVRPQEDRSKSKPNWREKHQQLIQSIREARSVTKAMKEGGPLPAFRPSEVPSDYVSCPYCHRNFNEHAGKRHIPFCQSQRDRKQPPAPMKSNQPLNRGRTLPPQHSSQYRQNPQSSNSGIYSNGHDAYGNGYKHSNSAPMVQRRNHSELPPPPPPVQPPKASNGGGWSLRKLFGFGSKEEAPPPTDYYGNDDSYDYEPSPKYPPARQSQVVMRTGRNTENTTLNVRARQRNDEVSSYRPRLPPAQAPPSYGSGRNQYGDSQYKSTRPTAVGRMPASGVRCGDCGSMFTNAGARFCPQCGSRR